MSKLTNEAVLQALRHVNDPDLKRDLVTLNMIADIAIEGNKLNFTVVLTTPACPLKDVIKNDCLDAIEKYIGPEVEVYLAFDSKVTTKRDKKDVLPGVKNIIAVASGKGGVGKSTVAVNLALGLAKNGSSVGIIDADIYGPSIPLLLGLKGKRPGVEEVDGKHKIIPVEAHGLKVLSIGFLVDERQAVVWRGPMVSSALRQFVTDCIWGELDYLILDLPPGTGDIHMTLVQTVPVTGALIVTTPQDIALADAKKAIAMFKLDDIKVPVLGVVENMAYFTPPDMPDKKYYIFGQGGGKELSEQFEVPLLGQIPIIEDIRSAGTDETPALLGDNELLKSSFMDLAVSTERHVAIRNVSLAETEKVEITVS